MESAAETSRGASTEGVLPPALPPHLVWTNQSPPRVAYDRIQLPPEAQHTHPLYPRETGAVPPESPLIPHGPGAAPPEPPLSHHEPGAAPPGVLCPETVPSVSPVACFRIPLLSGAHGAVPGLPQMSPPEADQLAAAVAMPVPASTHPAQVSRLPEASVRHARIAQARSPHRTTISLQALPPV